jgi:hypothetical protein
VEVYAGLGLRPDELTVITRVLAAYDHTNAMAVLALSALRALLDGRVPEDTTAAGSMPMPDEPRIPLPRLLDLAEMRPETAAIVTALNEFGTRRPGAVLASMYRHLAHWPSYLSFAWLLLAPLHYDGQLASAIGQAQRVVLTRADRLLVRLINSAAVPPPVLAMPISAALEPFVGDVIVRMLVICAFLRRITA